MTDDKKKPATVAKPPPSKEDVSATLIACGLGQDPSSRRITSAIIADNIKDGRKGTEILVSTNGVPENVGSCVANFYEGKSPNLIDKLEAGWKNLRENFGLAVAGAKEKTVEAVREGAPVGANIATSGGVDVIRTYQRETAERASQISGPGATR
jgi:hypothetical protein